ncbi:gallate dioxygenase, partial [Escherichia coli]
EKLTEMTLGEYAELGGMEGSEVIMWLVMRGALSANVTETWRDYYLPSMTGIATLILENNARLPPVDTLTRHRQHMAQQLAWVE